MSIKKSNGFSILELMTVVAIIGILVLVAWPTYSNYVLTVRIAEIVNNVQVAHIVEEAQIALGTGQPWSIDLKKISDESGVRLNTDNNVGCANGYRRGELIIPKSKLPYLGITSPYIYELTIRGQIFKPCHLPQGSQPAYDNIYVNFAMDTKALGLPNKSGKLKQNRLRISIYNSTVRFIDAKKNVVERGAPVTVCSIDPLEGDNIADIPGRLGRLDIPLKSIPIGCRYYQMPGTLRFVDLSTWI